MLKIILTHASCENSKIVKKSPFLGVFSKNARFQILHVLIFEKPSIISKFWSVSNIFEIFKKFNSVNFSKSSCENDGLKISIFAKILFRSVFQNHAKKFQFQFFFVLGPYLQILFLCVRPKIWTSIKYKENPLNGFHEQDISKSCEKYEKFSYAQTTLNKRLEDILKKVKQLT